MRPNEVMPHLTVGQYVAQMAPLALLCVEDVEGCYRMRYWSPEKEANDMICLAPLSPASANYRHLWYERIGKVYINLPSGDPRGFAVPLEGVPGDVYLIRHEGALEPRLIFIGPETKGPEAQVLADWELPRDKNLALCKLYQPGPSRAAPPGKSVYEHLRDPAV